MSIDRSQIESIATSGRKLKDSDKDSDELIREISYRAESSVDRLQIYLDQKLRLAAYGISLGIAIGIMLVLMFTPNNFAPSFFGLGLYGPIAVAAGVLAPLLQRWGEEKLLA